MSFINTSVYSVTLSQRVPVSLFLPTDRTSGHLRPPKGVIYFLPGLSQSHEDFQNYTAANRYAMENHLAIVYVNAPYSFYQDMACGYNYYTYITEELPDLLSKMFVLPQDRKHRYVCGLSMGGYGALLLGLSRPDLYCACGSFSGCLDMGAMLEAAKDNEDYKRIFSPAFSENLEFKDSANLFKLAEDMSKLPPEEQCRVFVCCGKQDNNHFIYKQNQNFHNFVINLNLAEYKYMEWDGVHDFSFWDRAMMHSVAFFLKSHYDEKKLKLWRD